MAGFLQTALPFAGGALGSAFGPIGGLIGSGAGNLLGNWFGGGDSSSNGFQNKFSQASQDAQMNLLKSLQQPSMFQRESFDPIRNLYQQQFQQQTVPEIANRFTSGSGIDSSAFQQALGGAGAGLNAQLAALESQHNQGQQQAGFQQQGLDQNRMSQLMNLIQGQQGMEQQGNRDWWNNALGTGNLLARTGLGYLGQQSQNQLAGLQGQQGINQQGINAGLGKQSIPTQNAPQEGFVQPAVRGGIQAFNNWYYNR